MNRRLHGLYTRTERFKHWLSARFTPLGRTIILVSIISLFFGMNTQRTMIYQIFAVCSCTLLCSFLITLRFNSSLKVRRFLPEYCVAGERLRYRIEVENPTSRRANGLFYQENIVPYYPDWHEFSSSREEGEEKRNLFDRKMGYYRWLWLIRISERLRSDLTPLDAIGQGGKTKVEATLMPVARGSIALNGYFLVKRDPFGLCTKRLAGGETEKLLVFPRLYKVPHLSFKGSRKYHQGGISMAQDRGDSTEFLSLREYVHGDPVRHIDWKSTARSGKTTVKQYRDEYFSRYGLVLDSFTPRTYCELFEEAVSIAASIMMEQDNVNSVFDLLFVGGECLTCTMGSGLSSRQRMLETLASVTPCRDRSFAEMTALIKSQAGLLSGMVLVLIDIDEERKKAIRYLSSIRVPLKVVLVVRNREDHSDENLNSLGVPVTIVEYRDVEEQIRLI